MEWGSLDYHKLRYFWVAAQQGSFAAAGRILGVAQPTISTQVQALEAQLDGLLFERRGRRLELTDLGKVVRQYADQIFEIGAELERSVSAGKANSPPELLVGVADGVPKLVVRSLLEPAFKSGRKGRMECREWRTDILLNELIQHRMDVVIADISGSGSFPSRLVCYEAGSSGITLLASPSLARRARKGFPASLNHLPFLLPVLNSPLRSAMDAWFEANQVIPRAVAEVDDRALLNYFGQAGLGIFPSAYILENELCRQFNVARVGVLKGVRERYFVVTTARRLRHPAVALICELARKQFAAAAVRSCAQPA